MFKYLIQKRLESFVKRYFKKHPSVKLIVVAGSVGKTSTKVAIATVLSERFKVRLRDDNHNTQISAPLAILGVEYPDNIRSISAWRKAFKEAKQRINLPTDVDVIVQELGSDRIGEVPHFGTYLYPDIAVITAVSSEHMEYFRTIDNIAKEELSAANYSEMAIINKDDIDGIYAKYLTNPNTNTYGTSASAEYHFISQDCTTKDGNIGMFFAPELSDPMPTTIDVIGEHSLRPAVAAAAVAIKLGINTSELVRGLAKVRSLPGRMNKLRGVIGSTIIDDTYNSSPLAAESSLRVLYQLTSPQRIAVIGDMNELGETSANEHETLGKLCDPGLLAWVITVGNETEKYLAPVAKAKGCQVKSFKDAISAGIFVKGIIEEGATILFKGSQSGIFLEEAVKINLHSTSDEAQLVRQSSDWIKRKDVHFSRY